MISVYEAVSGGLKEIEDKRQRNLLRTRRDQGFFYQLEWVQWNLTGLTLSQGISR